MTDDSWFATIIDQAPDAIIVSDRQGRIQLWNAAAERLFGHASAQAIGESLDIIIPERLRAAHWRAFDRAMESGQTRYGGRTLTTRSMRRDGAKQYVDMSFALIKDETGAVTGALAFVRDATERHESERAMRERIAQLERSSGVTRPSADVRGPRPHPRIGCR